MQTAIFLPPLPRMSGGLAVLLHLGEHLARMGQDVCFVPREPMNITTSVPVLPWGALRLSPQHIWLVPEGWVNALAPGLAAGARCVLYVQNWAYVLGNLPQGTRWDQLPVQFLAVSEPVRWFMQQFVGKDAPILRPGIDAQLFYPSARSIGQGITSIRIAWMPRKNTALARQIRECVDARIQRLHPHMIIEWTEIHGKSRPEVAEDLRHAHIFLATGFPEGCPLPPLEAMASGCLVVGFSGLGGWDYLRQALPTEPWASHPWWPLPDVHWEGNAIICADADVPAAALAVERACQLVAENGSALGHILEQAAVTAAAYSVEHQYASVQRIWQALTIVP